MDTTPQAATPQPQTTPPDEPPPPAPPLEGGRRGRGDDRRDGRGNEPRSKAIDRRGRGRFRGRGSGQQRLIINNNLKK